MKLKHLLLILKGMAMGAADVVPGVSGGTIAFIAGIYEELIESIKSLNLDALKTLFTKGPVAFWKHINGSFLLSLVFGIAISILTLSKLIGYLLDYHPVLIWSFFFGLIIASIFLIAKEIDQWEKRMIAAITLSTLFSFYITIATPITSPDSLIFLFFAGFVAIIAMILPGISGAFILLLLGAYTVILGTVNDFRESLLIVDVPMMKHHLIRIIVFVSGCLIGLISFSRVLSWMFKNYKNTTLALLTGFMVGSLNKIWPWKETTQSMVAHEGKENEAVVPFIQENVWPWNFNTLNDIELQLSIVPIKEPQIILSVVMMLVGIGLILVLNRFSPGDE